jgi:hypothetical protein
LSAGVVLPFLAAGSRRRGVLRGAVPALAALIALSITAFGIDAATGMMRAQAAQQNLVATASVPEQLGRLLGLGGATAAVRSVALACFAVAFAALLVHTWRGRIGWIAASGWATLAMLVTSAWLMPWYVTWLLPLAALGRDRRLTAAALALCGYLVVMRTPL